MTRPYRELKNVPDTFAKKLEVELGATDWLIPETDIFDEPTRCYRINTEWNPIIMGLVSLLTDVGAWKNAEDENYVGIKAVQRFLQGFDCADIACDIIALLNDDEFFQNEYIPQVFGDYVSGQEAHETELETAYDDTPQSIGELIPTGAPNAIEQNALCYAIDKFVALYCSQKICTIQAKNFLQVAWNNLQEAMNAVYGLIEDFMVVYNPNIFSCFVDDTEALTVLPDAAAQEELGCFLYEELKDLVIDKDDFDAALLAAAMTLSGNAQKIACIMNQDNALMLYLNFLKAYNAALQRDDADCPCEAPDTYWMKEWDFSLGELGWIPAPTGNTAQYAGSYWENRTSNPPNSNRCSIYLNFDNAYVIRACGIDFEAGGRTGQNGDGERAEGFREVNVQGGGVFTGSTNGSTFNGRAEVAFRDLLEGVASHCYVCGITEAGTLVGGRFSRIHRIVLYGLPSSGAKPPGAVWVSGVPAAPTSLFP